MSAFSFDPLIRDVDATPPVQTATASALAIMVPAARQVWPPGKGGDSTMQLIIVAGSIRYGQDGQTGEDDTNEFNDLLEVDGGRPRTTKLRLRLSQHAGVNHLDGSASFGALGQIYLDMDEAYGVATDRSEVQRFALTGSPDVDVWFLSDVYGTAHAGGGTGDTSGQLSRMSYQAFILVRRARTTGG